MKKGSVRKKFLYVRKLFKKNKISAQKETASPASSLQIG